MKRLLDIHKTSVLPGVYNPISAMLAEKEGFEALYLSGAAITASLGMPDLGIITETELTWMVKLIRRAVNVPLVVDIDTGFGGTLNTKRTVEELSAVGANAVQIEDQLLPKKCGHLSGKKLISRIEMCHKIAMIKEAAPEMIVVGRTDARGVTNIEDALDRAKAYVSAGADVIFPEALTTLEEFSAFRESLPETPLLANMTEFGKTPLMTVDQFKEIGYNWVIFPVTALRASNFATRALYQTLKKNGTQKGLIDQMQTRKELYELIRYDSYEAVDHKIASKIKHV